jgi:long-subunit fatty acid transport protein
MLDLCESGGQPCLPVLGIDNRCSGDNHEQYEETVGSYPLGAFALASGMAFGSGFAILEQSPRGLGASFAGMAAKIDDPGALYFNPAVSAWFKESQLMLGTTIIRSSATFANDGSTHYNGDPILGDNGGNAGGYSLIPNFYLIHPLGERWAFGLGITATSGTETTWGENWVGRYQAIKTAASTIDISPSFSWMATDNLSIGAALNIQYMQFEKINKVDGNIAAHHVEDGLRAKAAAIIGNPASTAAELVAAANMIGLADVIAGYDVDTNMPPGSADTTLEINEDSLSFGWSLGMVFQPTAPREMPK